MQIIRATKKWFGRPWVIRWATHEFRLIHSTDRYDIFTPSKIFSPLTLSGGKTYCSQISLNYIICLYNQEPSTLWLFTESYLSQTVLIQSLNLSTWQSTTKRISCQSASFMGWIYIFLYIYIYHIKHPGIFTLLIHMLGVRIFKYDHP